MMDDSKPFDRSPVASEVPGPEPVASEPIAEIQPGADTDTPSDPAGAPENAAHTPMPDAAELEASAAVMKFKSCRWRSDPETGEFCTHRDVLPFAGKAAFNPESWCPECAFYKLRRTPKKRERVDYSY
jgi:hypothetical protein